MLLNILDEVKDMFWSDFGHPVVLSSWIISINNYLSIKENNHYYFTIIVLWRFMFNSLSCCTRVNAAQTWGCVSTCVLFRTQQWPLTFSAAFVPEVNFPFVFFIDFPANSSIKSLKHQTKPNCWEMTHENDFKPKSDLKRRGYKTVNDTNELLSFHF